MFTYVLYKCIRDHLDSEPDPQPDRTPKSESNISFSWLSNYNFVFKKESKKTFSCFVCNAKFSEKDLDSIPNNVSMERLISVVKKRRTYLKGTNEKELEKGEDA